MFKIFAKASDVAEPHHAAEDWVVYPVARQ